MFRRAPAVIWGARINTKVGPVCARTAVGDFTGDGLGTGDAAARAGTGVGEVVGVPPHPVPRTAANSAADVRQSPKPQLLNGFDTAACLRGDDIRLLSDRAVL